MKEALRRQDTVPLALLKEFVKFLSRSITSSYIVARNKNINNFCPEKMVSISVKTCQNVTLKDNSKFKGLIRLNGITR